MRSRLRLKTDFGNSKCLIGRPTARRRQLACEWRPLHATQPVALSHVPSEPTCFLQPLVPARIGGPQTLTFREVIYEAAEAHGKPRERVRILPLPIGLLRLAAPVAWLLGLVWQPAAAVDSALRFMIYSTTHDSSEPTAETDGLVCNQSWAPQSCQAVPCRLALPSRCEHGGAPRPARPFAGHRPPPGLPVLHDPACRSRHVLRQPHCGRPLPRSGAAGTAAAASRTAGTAAGGRAAAAGAAGARRRRW